MVRHARHFVYNSIHVPPLPAKCKANICDVVDLRPSLLLHSTDILHLRKTAWLASIVAVGHFPTLISKRPRHAAGYKLSLRGITYGSTHEVALVHHRGAEEGRVIVIAVLAALAARPCAAHAVLLPCWGVSLCCLLVSYAVGRQRTLFEYPVCSRVVGQQLFSSSQN